MIEIRNASKTINGNTILSNVDAIIPAGKVTGFSGVNGSGKTMLMRLMVGLIKPTSGEVIVDGQPLWKDISFPESIGFLIESPSFIDSYSGLKNLRIIASIKSRIRDCQVKSCLERVGLDPDDKRKYKKYSLGMKQRLGIAAAIMEAPALIILDEPTNALDEAGIELLERIVMQERDRGAAVVLSCHDSEILERLSDVVYYLDSGKVIKVNKKGSNCHV